MFKKTLDQYISTLRHIYISILGENDVEKSVEEEIEKRCKPNGLFCPMTHSRAIAIAERMSKGMNQQ